MSFVLAVITFLPLALVCSEINNSSERTVIENERVVDGFQVNFSNESVVSEVQYTICSIKTEDVTAKAQSTASRVLKGICTSDEMMKALRNLETSIMAKLEQLQHNLTTFIQSKFQPVNERKNYRTSKSSVFKTIGYLFDQNTMKNNA